MEKPLADTRVALLDYYVTASKIIIYLIRNNLDNPLVFETKITDSEYSTATYLELIAQRLLVDYNGLAPGWMNKPFAHEVVASLKLSPAVSQHRRSRDPNYPDHILDDPDYNFQRTYFIRLSEVLFPDSLKKEIENCNLLCISPHGPLHQLPLHALNWNDENYIIEKFGVCYIPSASILRYCQQKNKMRNNSSHKPSSCVVTCAGTSNDGNIFDKDIDILSEYNWSKGFISLKGAEAVKERVLGEMKGKDIVHFACHGLFGGDFGGEPLDSGLLLVSSDNGGDGKAIDLSAVTRLDPLARNTVILKAREIFNLSLDSDLVTLRACSSGRSHVARGDELIGLTRSFLYAGTPSMIVSLWNVHIETSRKLLSDFYKLWLDSDLAVPKWQALQLAQISLLKSHDRNFANPYHWAPFILVGDWL